VISSTSETILSIEDLHASVEDQEILHGVNLLVKEGEIHAIMGRNGSGKSTLSKVIAGHPSYKVLSGSIQFKGKDILELEPEERARIGIFLGFQYPVEIPGVSNLEFLRVATNSRRKELLKNELDSFKDNLTQKVSWIICNKIDLIQEDQIELIEKEINTKLNIPTKDIFFISAATGKGTNKLLKSLETEVLYNKSDLT